MGLSSRVYANASSCSRGVNASGGKAGSPSLRWLTSLRGASALEGEARGGGCGGGAGAPFSRLRSSDDERAWLRRGRGGGGGGGSFRGNYESQFFNLN